MLRDLWRRWGIPQRLIPDSPVFIYGSHAHRSKKQTLKLCDRCCMQPWRKAEKWHHLKYRRGKLRRLVGYLLLGHHLGSSVADYEIPGWDVVGVSDYCHENYYGATRTNKHSVHFVGNDGIKPSWIKDSRGSTFNRQSHAIALRLRLTFWLLAGGWILIPFPLLVYFFTQLFHQ